MLRASLLGLLSISTICVASCSNSDQAAAQPGHVAGKVVEVTGNVTISTKPLKAGDSVVASDVVQTGADGHVVIELVHNRARWELGPNKLERVADSLAWGLPKKAGIATVVEQDTSAAGRPAERSAADTSTSGGGVPLPAAARDEQPATPAPAKIEQRKAIGAPPTAPRPPPPPPTLEPHAQAAQISAAGGGGGIVSQKPIVGQVTASIELGTLKACLATGADVRLTVHFATTTIDFATAIDDKTKTCLTNAIKKLKLVRTDDLTLEIKN